MTWHYVNREKVRKKNLRENECYELISSINKSESFVIFFCIFYVIITFNK